MAKVMRVEVSLNKLGNKEWPEGVAKSVTIGIPIPDNFADFTPAQLETVWKGFKQWNTQGKGKLSDGTEYVYQFMKAPPKLYDVLVEGIKVFARKDGNAILQEAARKAIGKPAGRGKKSTVRMD